MAAEQLTQAQAMAVERPGGPILVSAAAGSGKTKVIVERLMSRILRREDPCNVDEFLIITFTKKAASELRGKIAQALAERLSEQPENTHLQRQQSRIYLTQISTVHAFCADLLREFACELDLPADFRMLEETEAAVLQQQLIEDLLEERYAGLEQDEALQTLVDGLGAGRDDRRIPELILGVYQTAQCRLNPTGWLDTCQAQMELEDITDAGQTVWGAWLIQSFRQMLEDQRQILSRAADLVNRTDALEKYRPGFAKCLGTLEYLGGLTTWDAHWAAADAAPDFGKLAAIRDCKEPELQSRVKTVRDGAIRRVRDWLQEFYGPSDTVLADLRQTGSALRALFALTKEFSGRYDAEKRRLHGLDFNDLEHGAVRLLLKADGKTPTEAANRVSTRFREIMVDEYQDTNQVQDSIFRAISHRGRNRFMVGDVKQSIYRFRLAEPAIFLKKYREYPDAADAAPDQRQRILLSDNFRSGGPILDAVNAVFSGCMSEQLGGLVYGPKEALHEGCPHDPLPQTQVELHCLQTEAGEGEEQSPDKHRAEAEYAACRIRRLLDENTPIRDKEGLRPVRPGDVVILLRSPKNAAEYYLDALRRQGIPAASDSGESILDTAEVESLICLLKCLDNAHQDIPLVGALLSPILGASASDLGRAAGREKDMDLYDALQRARQEIPELEPPLALLEELRALAQELPVHGLLEQIARRTGLESVYGAMPNGPVRLRNLHLFYELAFSYTENGKKSLHQLLTYLQVLKDRGGLSVETGRSDAVTVMSIHRSKGLEFPVVLLCGLSKGFNQEDTRQPVQFHSALGAGCDVYDAPTHTRFASIAKTAISRLTQQENASEELRILYVAMTRAKDMLIMTDCSARAEKRLQKLAERIAPGNAADLALEAGSLGDWVLQTALRRTEAGELHAVSGRPAEVLVSEIPWKIEFHRLSGGKTGGPAAETAPQPAALDLEELAQSLNDRYPYPGAVTVPSKLTATQLKGRSLDEEASEGAPHRESSRAALRKPSLMRGDRPLTAAQKGTAMHQAMQYLDFHRVGSLEEIRAQLQRMVEDRFLTPQQAACVSPEKLLRVFEGPLGELIRGADQVIREFKFSILTDAGAYAPLAAGEPLMLQGVTDCCLIRNGVITIVDFKTDRIRPGEEQTAGERYRGQLEAYSLALSRVYGLPVGRRLLYFFATDALTELQPRKSELPDCAP